MTNSIIAIFTIALYFLVPLADAFGTIEMLVSSPRTILLESTVCANFECPAPDDLSTPRKVQAGTALRFGTGRYNGEARERIDLHIKVIEPITNDVLAIEHHRPLADNKWNQDTPIVVKTSKGFNVTVQLRNKCESFYYGNRCGRYCIPSRDQHWECSSEGERRCSVGWTGGDCSNPICPGGCSGRGKCVAPNQCSCINGFNGTQCEQCLPRAGCVNGGCHNGVPNTCKCRDGFIGDRCDIDIKICSLQKPCANGGQCSIDSKSSTGYKCECPFDFIGPQCKTALNEVRCAASAQHVCQNGGACISMDEKTIQCKCPKGFTGKFCEYGTHKDCSMMKCSETATCHMSGDLAICVENEKTTVIPPVRTPTERVKAVEEMRKTLTRKEEEEIAMKAFQDNILTFALLLVCIIGVSFSIFLFYTRIYLPLHQRANPSTGSLPTTSTSSRPSPVYKVCIIDTEQMPSSSSNSSDSEPDHLCHPHRHSPPPAYSSPVMSQKVYKSIPTMDDDSSFRV
ncbi:CRE-APX-1 protein [Caenorhabditis remanei]|uniref:Delta-like protein n=1 Tax=Caenorhabditis remanei TaxID=31234 RepID=E3LKX3_CAERE|nr:CRE-APX-1 protein [Caenorhabditis remanei]